MATRLVIHCIFVTGLSQAADDVRHAVAVRRPVAVAIAKNRLFVANRDSGTVSIVDAQQRKPVAEYVAGGQLSDLTALGDGPWLLATEERDHRLVLLHCEHNDVRVVSQHAVPQSPVRIVSFGDGLSATACLWARQLVIHEFRSKGVEDARLRRVATISLPFAPREMLFLREDRQLIVADAFGPHLAVIDARTWQVQAIHRIPGHNLRGLAVDGETKELLVSHQTLSEFIPTTRDHVFWGNSVVNLMRRIPLSELARPPHRRSTFGSIYPLGRERRGAGDPGRMIRTRRGTTLVLLSGVGEVAWRENDWTEFRRLPVGRGPAAIAYDETDEVAYVANRFDDSLTVVDVHQGAVVDTIGLGQWGELTDVQRGQELFYDAHRSLDGWFSCHSCHTDGHTCELLNDNFGDDTFGAPKRVPSLLGAGDTGPWAWIGSQTSLEDQIHKSLRVTMYGSEEPEKSDVRALAAFVRSLPPPPSLDVARGTVDTTAVARGERLFQTWHCDDCHQPPQYTSEGSFDVGIADENGWSKFNPPSLRGISQRSRFFHDGRSESLRDVISIHRHPPSLGFLPAESELDDLIQFLRSL